MLYVTLILNVNVGRRRKIRCIFLPNNPKVCSRCSSRGWRCVDQRLAGSDQGEDEKKSLRERVARLEALLESTTVFNASSKEAADASDDYSVGSDESNGDYLVDVDAPLMALFDREESTPQSESEVNFHSLSSQPSSTTPGTESQYSRDKLSGRQEIPSSRHRKRAIEKLLATLPPYDQLLQVLTEKRTWWWASWREKTFGPSEAGESLTQYASRVFTSNDPLDVALLVQAYGRTVKKGSHRYLKAVESLVICKDEYAATIKGLECIMLQAKCYLDFGQPRRAWLMYRRGLTLAQLIVRTLDMPSIISANKMVFRICTVTIPVLPSMGEYGGHSITAIGSAASSLVFHTARMILRLTTLVLLPITQLHLLRPHISSCNEAAGFLEKLYFCINLLIHRTYPLSSIWTSSLKHLPRRCQQPGGILIFRAPITSIMTLN